MTLLNQLSKQKKLAFISIALLTVLLVSGTLAAPMTTNTANKTSTSAAKPFHLSHTMLPAQNMNQTALAGPDGCPFSASSGQCVAAYNWGGYAVQGPTGSVSEVVGSWTVPTITSSNTQARTCTDSESTWYDTSEWIGIDGFISQTVEQTGTASDCYYGVTYYYAWYEFYPAPSYTVFNVNPGDQITAVVTYSVKSSTFTTTITDVTTHTTYTATTPVSSVPGAQENSAEWIDESAFGFLGELALTQTNIIPFTGASATISGVTKTLGDWGTSVYWILEIDYNFGVNQETGYPSPQTLAQAKALPSGLNGPGDRSFQMIWLSYGP